MSQVSNLLRHILKADESEGARQKTFWLLVAWLVSMVLHPLLMPTFLHAIVFKYCGDLVPLTSKAKVQTLLFIFVGTYLIPIIATGLLWVTGVISSLSLERRSERLIPLLVTGLIYTGISYIFLDYLEMAQVLGLFMGIVALAVIITAVITHFWKISSHMVGIGGVVGFIFSVIQQTNNISLEGPLIAFIVGTGAVASSRLYLDAHTWPQIVAGFVLGLAVSWSSVYFFV